jgi:hypothetical protein
MWQPDQKIRKVDDALLSLRKERRRCTDPSDILRISESIDKRLDERLRLMRDRDLTTVG